MALVNYSSDSDSGSENERPQPAPPAAKPKTSATAPGQAKKPFQKLVDRSDPGKIRVSLPGGNPHADANGDDDDDGRPAKRAKKAGGMFASFNDFLPKPKNAGARGPAAGKTMTTTTTTAGTGGASSAGTPVGAGFKTGAGPGFVRDAPPSGQGAQDTGPRAEKGPEIPEGMKREEDVKLVGQPLMFKPLCVTRKTAAKKKKKPARVPPGVAARDPAAGGLSQQAAVQTSTANARGEPAAPGAQEPPPPPEKISLFSIPDLEPAGPTVEPEPQPGQAYSSYEPLYEPPPYPQYPNQEQAPPEPQRQEESLESLASAMNLPASAQRDLFGRAGAQASATMANARVLSFDTDAEYARNNELAASGALQAHQPVSKPTIQGSGKHSLRQLVGAVANQREALEESFARGKGKRKDAGARYGW